MYTAFTTAQVAYGGAALPNGVGHAGMAQQGQQQQQHQMTQPNSLESMFRNATCKYETPGIGKL